MAYYVMVCEGKYPVMPIAAGPKLGGNWRDGEEIKEAIKQPLVYKLNADYPGSPKPMYYEEAIPAVRDDVIKAWRRAGIENVQYFDAVLRNPKTRQEYANYKAYNIVGLVSCANMQASELMGTSSATMGDTDFHTLVIDESKTGGLVVVSTCGKRQRGRCP